METFDFPDSILERAQDITLAELLDSPLSQCWAVSMICNAFSSLDLHAPGTLNDKDRLMHYRLRDVAMSIPREERVELFHQCSRIINQKREERHAKIDFQQPTLTNEKN